MNHYGFYPQSSASFSRFLKSITTISGWIKSIRKQKNIWFAVITDGSSMQGLQAVCKPTGNHWRAVTRGIGSSSMSWGREQVRGVVASHWISVKIWLASWYRLFLVYWYLFSACFSLCRLHPMLHFHVYLRPWRRSKELSTWVLDVEASWLCPIG